MKDLILCLCDVSGILAAPWWFENPVSVISSIYRQPDHTFHPNEHADI